VTFCDIWAAKKKFFDDKIHEIASSNKRPWDFKTGYRKNLCQLSRLSHMRTGLVTLYWIYGILFITLITQLKIDLLTLAFLMNSLE